MAAYYWKMSDKSSTFTKNMNAINRNKSWVHEHEDEQETPKGQWKRDVLESAETFSHRTSIMGVMQIATRKGYFWKLFWTLITIASSAMALYQSWNILQDYVSGKTVQSTEYTTQFEFPSITLCSNIHLNESAKIGYEAVNATNLDRANLSQLIPFVNALLVKENENDHSPFGAPMILSKCIFNRKNCNQGDENDIYHFDTALYGNCLTYNPATKIQKKSKPNYYLTLEIPMDAQSRKHEHNDNYVSVWIHPPGSAPLLDRQEDIRVFPGDSMDIKLQLKKIEYLPKRGNECVNPETFEKRFSSIYYTNKTTYLYTSRACIYSMTFDLMRDTIKCLDPTVPRNEKWIYHWKSGNYNICFPGSNTQLLETEFNETLFNFQPNCTVACGEWIMDNVIISRSAWFESLVDRSLKNKTAGPFDINFDSGKASVKVRLGSPMIEDVKEFYKYTFGDCAGIIGGNIGVWIGLCAISLAEVVEFFISLIIIKLKSCCTDDKEKPQIFQINHKNKKNINIK